MFSPIGFLVIVVGLILIGVGILTLV
jgi:hypothetical protein